MAKQISQETFDAVVKENMEEFEMEGEEAVQEAVQQFESQGVDLSNIVKTLNLGSSPSGGPEHAVLQALSDLSTLLTSDSPDPEKLTSALQTFQEQCKVSFSHRSLAASKDGYKVMFSACTKFNDDANMLCRCIETFGAFLEGQPDLIDEASMTFLVQTLTKFPDDAPLQASTFKAIYATCLKHETNRQAYIEHGLLPCLMKALETHGANADVVKSACTVVRVLTFDDDIRVPFGKAHEHAKMMVMENKALETLLACLTACKGDAGTTSEVCLTLSRLAVRNEFCQAIVDLGGLDLVLNVMRDNVRHQALASRGISLLKAIAGNDDVKTKIVQTGGMELIITALNIHIGVAQVCEEGCAALCALALRNTDNVKAIMAANGAEAVVQAMKVHMDKSSVQKQGCMAIRNLVARTRDFAGPILELGAEDIINEARARHKDVEDVGKAAIRDLGGQVELRVLWKGEGRGIKH
ncbi:PREDICTED: armadillo repeat-containing protein 6-like [Branchiostoma belcheri]|uniref:Armadillo repeat-containing protein 6-like n=1 Tax=Branchiostoma belcheri TaxID=7741 RepID=A0A6P4YT38_BRABE|nr:PREDICTED: armadillo repeat-containing protein 6-like [Branchiostoma belcheri]